MYEGGSARVGIGEADVTGDVHHHSLDVNRVVVSVVVCIRRIEVYADNRVEESRGIAIFVVFSVAGFVTFMLSGM